MKLPEYNIKANGGGEGLSILKKIYFTLSKSYIST